MLSLVGVDDSILRHRRVAASSRDILPMSFGEKTTVSTEMPAALASDLAGSDADVQQARREWIETALVVLFTAAAVVCASVLAVVTGLV
jgi:hypothetical protein